MEDPRKTSQCYFSRLGSSMVRTIFVLAAGSFGFGSCNSFCINTLSRPFCPDLQTFDQFNISAYGGRWYEIGSNGYFKNFEEAGGSCVTADYKVVNNNVSKAGSPALGIQFKPSPSISVVNSFNKQIGPIATSVVQGISLRAGTVCQQTRQICTQTHVHGDLFRGLSLVDALASKIVPNFSLEGDGLVKCKLQIEDAVEKINETLDSMASTISQLQVTNSNLSQAVGDQGESVASLTDLARQGSAGAEDILTALNEISTARLQVARIAGLLFGISNAEQYLFGENSSISTERAAVKLFKAEALIHTAEESIHGPLAIIKATLEGAAQSASLLGVDSTGPSTGATPFFQGQATPMVGNHSGRLVMNSFYSGPQDGNLAMTVPDPFNNGTDISTNPSWAWSTSTAGNYWILAAEGNASTGYDAALVYGCQQNPAGGVLQPVSMLSRQPTLSQDVIDKFFGVLSALGIDQDCAEPFIFTDQGDSCAYPPSPASFQLMF